MNQRRQLEATAQARAGALLHEQGVLVRRRAADHTTGRGWPDVECQARGRCVHVEWKSGPGEHLSPEQRWRCRELRRYGMTVLVGAGVDDVDRVVALVIREVIGGSRAPSDEIEFAVDDGREVARG